MGKHFPIAVLCAVSFASAAWSGSRALVLEDYFRLVNVADPHLSPDGHLVAYAVSRSDAGQGRKSSTIWVAAADGSGEPRQFTTEGSATHPRWSPDGQSLAFLTSRSTGTERAGNQIWVLSMHGGEARQVTKLKSGVSDFEWSPDGKRFVLVSKVGPEIPRDAGDERVYLNPWYKADGSGYSDNQHPHIWVADATTGAATQITKGDARDDITPRWSPDGTHIVFVARRLDGNYKTNEDVWIVPASGGDLTKVSDHTSRISKPVFSHDGRSIVYIASEANEVPKLWIAPASGGGKSELAAREFTYPEEVDWSHDDRALMALAPWHGASILYHIDLSTHTASPVTGPDRIVTSADFNEHSGRMTYLAADSTHTADVYSADEHGRSEHQLTHLNRDLWSEIEVQPMERVPFRGADGWEVEGFLIPPRDRKPGVKYPLILAIHGGPNGMSSMTWSHEFQMYAARGYAVFTTNPRGSSGYGEKFQRGVELQWGGNAYRDIMAGIDEVLRRNPWIDPNRMAVRGQSYGGFMTNWIVSHTDRFHAAATLSGISDFVSDEGVRDGFYGHAYDFGGDLLEHFETYWNTSPLQYARNVHTPVLILHGEADQRVPLSQGEEWFRALRFYGKTAELVVYPREPHSLRIEPKHAVSVTRRQLEWFDRYLNRDAASASR